MGSPSWFHHAAARGAAAGWSARANVAGKDMAGAPA
jgi:hypothetical protein